MVLTQAEDEGYSVFVVRAAGEGAGGADADMDPGEAHGWGDSGVGALPESAADTIALELGDVESRDGALTENGHASRKLPFSRAGRELTVERSELTPASGTSNQQNDSPPSGAGTGRRRRRQEDLTSDDVEDDDLLARSAPGSGGRTPQPSRSYVEVAASGVPDDDEELDDAPSQRQSRAPLHPILSAYGGPVDFQYNARSYDDEDEALQAALRASMEDLPDDYVMPELAPIRPPPALRQASPPHPVIAPEPPSPAPPSETHESSIAEDTDDEPAAEPSPGE